MSDLRIALVAEGPTDRVIIEAALTAILDARTFILTQLQPEKTRPEMGGGWGGVLKWCHAAGQRHTGSLDDDPTLQDFDLLIIQLDGDVAGFAYANQGAEVVALASDAGWQPLPCAEDCPPPALTIAKLEVVLRSWLAQAMVGSSTALCIPAQSSGTWLAAAILSSDHTLLRDIECNTGVENGLAILPRAQRVKKRVRDYQAKAREITTEWDRVKAKCEQAVVFEHAVLAAI